MDKNIFFLFLSIDIFYCLAFLEYNSLHTVIMYHVFIASRRPQSFKEDTDSTDATDLFFHGLSPPPVPLGGLKVWHWLLGSQADNP